MRICQRVARVRVKCVSKVTHGRELNEVPPMIFHSPLVSKFSLGFRLRMFAFMTLDSLFKT